MYEESLDHLLEVWVRFVDDTEAFPPHLITQPCLDVFTAYVQSKLTSPLGWRSTQTADDTEVIVEIEDDDRTFYADQLSCVGTLGRFIPAHTLPLLLNTLSQRISDYLQLYKLLQENKEALYSRQRELDLLHEDLHWLILISGYTLCNVAEGEDNFVPLHIMEYTITEQDQICKEVDFRSLVLSCANPGSGGVSVVVGVVAVICQWCVVEKVMVEAGFAELLSPQVCESAVWFLSCIAQSYLMLNDQCYKQVRYMYNTYMYLYRIVGKIGVAKFWRMSKKVVLANIILVVQHLGPTYYSLHSFRRVKVCANNYCPFTKFAKFYSL